jgi:hypothetical protein
MLLCEKLALKVRLITLTLPFALSLALAAEHGQAELKFPELGLRLALAPATAKRGPDKIILIVTNTSAHDGLLRLASPFVAGDSSKSSSARFPPWLGVLVRDPKSGREEQFVLTTFTRVRGPGRLVALPKGHSRKLQYRLRSFYRWGPCGPDLYGSFRDYFKPGTEEVEVRAVLFHDTDDSMVVSNPQTLRCAFPAWLFKAGTSVDEAARTSDANASTQARARVRQANGDSLGR